MSQVKITETALRDAHQSLIATRMTTEEMLPILSAMDGVGYHSLEVWGGATFDASMRFLHEDPWDRLRRIRAAVRKTRLQMLLRGQNLLGYRHYADDVVAYFVQKSLANGIDIIRVFDALNDPRNLETSVKAALREGGRVQAAFCYTTGPVFTTEYFASCAKRMEEMGADSVCVKDMAGLLRPYDAFQLVRALKETVRIPIQLHTHYTAGLASMTVLKAVEAGADIVDTAISPMALGTSQPPTEPIVAALQGTPYDTGLDLGKLDEVTRYFTALREKYLKGGQMNTKVLKVDVNALLYQVPGGMMSNLLSQLRQAGREDQLNEVLAEVPRVRADVGYPPLVTPSSQIVGTQAVLNVLTGERYGTVSEEFRNLILGKYGRTPVPVDPAFIERIAGGRERIDCRPADLIEPELERLRRALPAGLVEQEEDVLSYALFDRVALQFFEYRKRQRYGIDENAEHGVHPV